MNDDNIIRFGQVQGGRQEEDGLPENSYVIEDIDGCEWYGRGFLVFTPHHIAVMRDFGRGAVPVTVVPLNRVRGADIIEDEKEENADLPL